MFYKSTQNRVVRVANSRKWNPLVRRLVQQSARFFIALGISYSSAHLWGQSSPSTLEFLATLQAALRSDKAGIHFEEPASPATDIGATLNYDPSFVRQFERYYNTRNVWIRTGEPPKVGATLLAEERCTTDQFIKSEYYNDWLRPQNLFHMGGSVIGTQQGGRAYLAVIRS